MSNRQDSPSLDYFELRRRHEEYKNRERQVARDRQDTPREEQAPERILVYRKQVYLSIYFGTIPERGVLND